MRHQHGLRFLGLIALAAGILPAAAPGHSVGAPPTRGRLHQQVLFRSGEGGYAHYRIPGILRTERGSLLAYCEARRERGGDWGQIDIVMRRSLDGGESWTPQQRVVDPPDVPKNPVAAAQGLGEAGKITVNNPVCFYDARRSRIVMLYCVEYERIYRRFSNDEGATWSPAAEITSAASALRSRYPWRVVATGPGHGIQLRSGRLLIPIWLSTGTGGHAHRPSVVSTLYSDDGGENWRAGDIIVAHPELTNPSETVAVELSDGRVMVNIRHEGKGAEPRFRAVSTSPDGAGRWSPVYFDKALPEPICMASMMRIPASRGSASGPILFANPHNSVDRARRNLTLKLSRDEGASWPVTRVVEPGPSGYSDLAAAPDGRIYLFYERGALGSALNPASLTLARLDLEWLRQEG